MLHRMRLTGLVALALCVALVASSIAIACPSGGGSAGSASTVAAAKKKCKAGYHLVTVKKHGKRTKVCKKKPYTQQGP
jgi:hypothetical protein